MEPAVNGGAPLTVKPYYAPVANIDERASYALLRWLHKDQCGIKASRCVVRLAGMKGGGEGGGGAGGRAAGLAP
jgi:hypothetical protein